MRPDESHRRSAPAILNALGERGIVGERWGAGVDDHEVEVPRDIEDIRRVQIVRRRVHDPAAVNKRRRLSQPRGIPERAYLTPRLVARARAAVETLE